jgi:polysaccharide export outer membrane protein
MTAMRIDGRFKRLCILLLLSCSTMLSAADYLLGAGDLVRITVFGAPELSSEVRISETGNVTFPLIGQVPVSGRSAAQIEAIVTARLAEGGFVRDPQVSVLVLEFQSQKVAVLGLVAKPGQYPLQMTTRVLDLLANAGGVVNDKAADAATLVRKDGTKSAIDLDALFNGDPTQNLPISGGDTIYVPRAPQIYIYGEVQKPGMYRLERNMTVSRAISAGGGLTARGSERRAVVKRRTADGKEHEITVSGSDPLQSDDVLFVKESLF